MIRIGFGHDIHRFVSGRALVLCGVHVPYKEGLLGHSDADAPVHAIMDALLGALALGDIGKHFPDTDPKYKDADSMVLLKTVYELIKKEGYVIGNLDCTIHCERPKLLPFNTAMRQNIADALETDITNISIKAGTNEGIDGVGSGLALSCDAVVLINRREE